MADDLGLEFFKAAKSQLDSAVKWQILVVAILLYLHFAIVAPFGEKSTEKVALDRDLAQQRALAGALGPAAARAQAFTDQAKFLVANASDTLSSGLLMRFGKLNEAVAALVTMTEQDAAGQFGLDVFGPGQAQLQMQQQPLPDPSDIALLPMDENLRRYIARQGNEFGELTPELEAYIQKALIDPAFEEANNRLGVEMPAVQREADEVLAAIAGVKGMDVNGARAVDALGKSVLALRDQIGAFRFTPPPAPDWWRTVAGKGESIRMMLESITAGIEDTAGSKIDLAAILSNVQSVMAEKEQASAKIDAELKRLEAELVEWQVQAAELQAQLGEISELLKVIAIKLSLVAPFLPLIIASAIAGGSLWSAEALRKMRLALSMPIRSEQQANMQVWLKDIVGPTHQRLAWREVLLLAVLMAWVLAAIYVTRSLESAELRHWQIAALSLILVIGVRAWAWRQSLRALDVAERPA